MSNPGEQAVADLPRNAAYVPDAAQITAFLDLLRPRKWLNIVAIKPAPSKDFCAIVHGRTVPVIDEQDRWKDVVAFAETRQAAGFNVYFTMNNLARSVRRKPAKKDIASAAFIYRDIDPKSGGASYEERRAATLATLPDVLREEKPSFVIDSGHGLQVLIRLSEPVKDQIEFEAVNKAYSVKYGGDATQNIDRVFRLPGTWNFPSKLKIETHGYPAEPIMARLLHHDPDAAVPFAHLQELVADFRDDAAKRPDVDPGASAKPKRAHTNNFGFSAKLDEDRQSDGSRTGDRSAFQFGVICRLLKEGYSAVEIRNSAESEPWGTRYREGTGNFEHDLGKAQAEVDREDDPTKPKYRSFGPFKMTSRGLYFKDASDEDAKELHLSGAFEILARTQDGSGGAWGVLLAWTDGAGIKHTWAMPIHLLSGDSSEIRKRLLDQGLFVTNNRVGRELLSTYLGSVHLDAIVRCVTRPGWHGRSYVVADRVYGPADAEQIVYQPDTVQPPADAAAGTLDGWKDQIARYAVGNSRMVLAISMAFCAPLLHLVGEESGVLHLVGPSSSGKTTVVLVAATVSGIGIHSWRATDNGLEGVAAAANDGLLILDEMSQVDARAADAISYMLGNGQGKARASRNGLARQIASWRVLVLSTGEIGLAEKMGEIGRKARAGQAVRIIEIPSDAGKGMGIFENLHGFADGDALARHLRAACDQHKGLAMQAFLEHVVKAADALPQLIQACRAQWLKANLPLRSDGQVSRVAGRFALIAAAGELAIGWGILPWTAGEAERAAVACFKVWLGQRGGTGAFEIQAGIEQVRAFIVQHGSSRFEAIGNDANQEFETKTINRTGWREKIDGAWNYYIPASTWNSELCKGFDSKVVGRELLASGLIKGGEQGARTTRSISIKGFGKVRVYHLLPAIIERQSPS